MDQSLKQRLVGAIVLVSLAVIFLPLVFDGQQERIHSDDYVYPDQPAMTIQSSDFTAIEVEAKQVLDQIDAVESSKHEQEQLSSEQYGQENLQDQPSSEPIPATVEQYVEQETATDLAIEESTSNTVELADAWVIQVGAFSSQTNANGLRDELVAAGYKAYTKRVDTLFKVYIGPEIRRHRLEQQKSELEQKFKVKTLILKYIP
ncbi:MAG: SPOR domain-containing protein [Pseudomonadota bacterium]|nr:SPOR domain-containing protein [Pseudomonadota bacterium]